MTVVRYCPEHGTNNCNCVTGTASGKYVDTVKVTELVHSMIKEEAMLWWNEMNLEEQFYTIIEHNDLIAGDKTRHPSTLTGREIKDIYIYINENN